MTDYRDYRRVKAGESVQLDDGTVVRPEEVVGPERPGASFAYITDTMPCPGASLLAREADLVYHEATYGCGHEKNAVDTGHSTASDAARVALEAKAKCLLLGHFSARYENPNVLVEEARRTFKNTLAAEELRRYELRNCTEDASS